MKWYNALMVLIVCFIIYMAFIPKSCEPSGKYKQLESKSSQSLKADSIQSIETKRIRKTNDSLITELKTRDSLHKIRIETLSGKYYALRATVKKLQLVRIDSSGQTVSVPADQYNASINSGTMCDSLLMYMDQELQIKDSIISIRDIDVKELESMITTKENALTDLIALNEEKNGKIKSLKKQNRALKTIVLIETAILAIAAILF